MCWLRGWRFSRLHLWDELVRIYLPFHSLTALLSLMAEVRTITQTIGKVLRLMILCVNYFPHSEHYGIRKQRSSCLWDEISKVLSLRKRNGGGFHEDWGSEAAGAGRVVNGCALGASERQGLWDHGKVHTAKGTFGLKVLENIGAL